MSSLHENQSKLIFPLNCIERENISFEENNLTISIFHHPYHWLESNNIRQFKELLTDSSDYILTGHEHTPSAKKKLIFLIKKCN
jgi:predicted phosphodiesterase